MFICLFVVFCLFIYYYCCCYSDIDECSGINNCSRGSTCVNTIGSYQCPCQRGYYGIDNVDICIGKKKDLLPTYTVE